MVYTVRFSGIIPSIRSWIKTLCGLLKSQRISVKIADIKVVVIGLLEILMAALFYLLARILGSRPSWFYIV